MEWMMSSPASRATSSATPPAASRANQPATPTDAALRRAVLDPAQSWMLQAPAGSGKTELLMQRFLACLATVEQPESVLAITFTRKAAAEMRNRILGSLTSAAELNSEELAKLPPHKQQSLQLARAVLNASAALGWDLLQNPARLQVRTLDSFCESVAQRAPFKGLLGGAAQVTEDAQPLYELAAQRVIDSLAAPGSLGDAVAALLEQLENDVRAARDLLAAMLAQRDQWLHFLGRSDAFDAVQQQTLRQRLESALARAIKEDLALIREQTLSAINADHAAELFAVMRYAARAHEGIATSVIDSIAASAERPQPAASALPSRPQPAASAWPPASSESLPAWRTIADFLLTGGNTLRKTVDTRRGFPTGTPNEKAWKKRCVDLLKELAAMPAADELCEALTRIRRLPDPHYTESQWHFMLAVLELLPVTAANLQVVFAEKCVVDFAEYAQRALQAIGQQGDPTELGLQMGYRIRHILVDEFQDTNGIQVELLSRLLATWEQDEQCSTFCVGDPMQSIYAFRQADVAIYQQARREGLGGREHHFGCLSQNFRSQANLVAWFNQVFPAILREQSDLTNAVRYEPSEPTHPALDEPAVAIQSFAKGDRAGEARHIAECIRRELAIPTAPDAATLNAKPSTIAVLVRSRTHLPALVEALRAAGIPYRAVKTDRLADLPLIRDLESLRMALTNLADRTAWLSILRAPWCGLTLADLLEICRGDERSTVWEFLHRRGNQPGTSPEAQLSAHARTVLARCVPVLDDALSRSGRGSLRTLVESTWLRLGGPACLAQTTQEIRATEAYFALLEAQSTAGVVRDPENFAAKLHELFAPTDHASGIRVEVMPIHQAKGLEWDVVFLPALERRSRQDDKSLLYWRRRRGVTESLLLGPMEAQGKKDRKSATIESYLRDIAVDCSREELKRLFYVAATRARKRLYLSASVAADRKPDANSILRLLWDVPGMEQHFAPPSTPLASAPAEPAAPSPTLGLRLRRLPADFVMPTMPPPLQWSSPHAAASVEQHRFEWVGELLPRIGVVTHSFLQRIVHEGLEHWPIERIAAERPAIAASLLNAGVMSSVMSGVTSSASGGELEQGITRVSSALERTLQDERGRWLLSPHPEQRSELAVSAVIDGELQHVRIDRTFIDGGTRWLIDYKITQHLGGDPNRFMQSQVDKYRPDMQRYVRVMRALDPRPIRCALYLPLLGQFRPVEVELAHGEAGIS
jgi:ATP-dependent exoDNAse (exonuclease V) beta subunit